jgi:hypothetical protein
MNRVVSGVFGHDALSYQSNFFTVNADTNGKIVSLDYIVLISMLCRTSLVGGDLFVCQQKNSETFGVSVCLNTICHLDQK